jgi:hypothetical protein
MKLFYRRPNKASPFILLLKNIYFISKCTINLVSTSQLGMDSIAFDSKVPYLKAFSSSIEILYSIT